MLYSATTVGLLCRQTDQICKEDLASLGLNDDHFWILIGNCTGNNNRWRSSVKLYGRICSRSSISVVIVKATTEPWFRNFCLGDHSHDCVLRYPSSSGQFMLQENRAQNDPNLSTSMSPMTTRSIFQDGASVIRI